jgi:hypothetical protein
MAGTVTLILVKPVEIVRLQAHPGGGGGEGVRIVMYLWDSRETEVQGDNLSGSTNPLKVRMALPVMGSTTTIAGRSYTL